MPTDDKFAAYRERIRAYIKSEDPSVVATPSEDPKEELRKRARAAIESITMTGETQSTEFQPSQARSQQDQLLASVRDDPVKLAIASAGRVSQDIGVGVIRAGLDTAQEVYKGALEVGGYLAGLLDKPELQEELKTKRGDVGYRIDVERQQFNRALDPTTKSVVDRASTLAKFTGSLAATGGGGILAQTARGAATGALSSLSSKRTGEESVLGEVLPTAAITGAAGGTIAAAAKGISSISNFFNSKDRAVIELSEEIAKDPKFRDTIKAAKQVGVHLTPDQALPGSIKTQVKGKDIAKAIPDMDNALIQQEQILKTNDKAVFSYLNKVFDKVDDFSEGVDAKLVDDIANKAFSTKAAAKAEAIIKSEKAYDVVNNATISDDALLKLMNPKDPIGQKIIDTLKLARGENGSSFVKSFYDQKGLKSGGVWTNLKRYLDEAGGVEAKAAAGRITKILDPEIPAFKQARELYKSGFDDHLARISPKLANVLNRKIKDWKTVARTLFDEGQDLNDFKAMRDLIQQSDPALWMSTVNNHISKVLYKAKQAKIGEWPKQIDKLLFKNKAQQKLLESALEAHPLKAEGLRDLIKVTKAISKEEAIRVAAASTASNSVGRVAGGITSGALVGGATAGPLGAATGAVAGGIFRSGIVDDALRAIRTKALVNLYMSPKWIDEASKIVNVKRTKGVGAAAKAMIGLFTASPVLVLDQEKD